MNALETYRTTNGLTFDALADRAKNDRTSVFRHCKSGRISAEDALNYEATLGIPRHLLRPDLWPAPVPAAAAAQTQPQSAA